MENGPDMLNNLSVQNSYCIPPNPNFIKVSFDNLHLNVEPFVLFRQLNTFSRWLMIICVKKTDKNYNMLQTFIKDLTFNLEKGNTVNIDTTKEILKNNEISKYKWYNIDIRSDIDTTLDNKINIKFGEGSDLWYKSLYFDKIYNKCKGLIIYADSIDDIPCTMLSRSNMGLCTFTDIELTNFIYKCTAKYIENVLPQNNNGDIVGYVNAHKWTKLVKL
jgi:hypothetical protein